MIVYKSHVTRSILSYQIESGRGGGGEENLTEMKCSIIETVYNSNELKSCPIEATFKIIGKKWTVLIIREMLRGVTQFNRFLENIQGITPKVLSGRLRELQKLGIIRRRIVSEYPIRVEYEITDLGREFEPVLLAAASFSMKNMPKIVFKDGKARNPSDFLIQLQ
jgi:DNA-binding HxlR family transcriptional regulator